MERHYRFAGVEMAVTMPETLFYEDEYHLRPFAVEKTEHPHTFSFDLAAALDPPQGDLVVEKPGFRIYGADDERIRYIGSVSCSWEDAYIRAVHRGKDHHVQVKAGAVAGRIGTKTVLSSIEVERLVARAGGFILHCAYIDHQGKAILFTAPSKTGKSTQAELWKSLRGAQIINGDRAAIRIADGRAIAEGIPFAGSSPYCENRSLPLGAIVYLGQAPQTAIRRMCGAEAFARIWEGVSVNTWDKTDVELVSGAVQRIAQTIQVYHLPCTPDEAAVIALENALRSR